MRGRPTTGWRRTAQVRAVELEFGLPFWKVVEGFAMDGLGRAETGRVLGWEGESFRRLLRRHDPGIPWPDPYRTAGYLSKRYEFTPARVAQARLNYDRWTK